MTDTIIVCAWEYNHVQIDSGGIRRTKKKMRMLRVLDDEGKPDYVFEEKTDKSTWRPTWQDKEALIQLAKAMVRPGFVYLGIGEYAQTEEEG